MGRLPQDRIAKSIRREAQNPKPFTGFCFRCIKPMYGNVRDAFSGQGGLYSPGRFHAANKFLIAYANIALEGALWECTHTRRNEGIHVANILPIMTLSARLELSRTLDLTDAAVLAALGVSLEMIRDSSWSLYSGEALTQRIGRLAHQAGFEAIIAPSGSGHPNINLLPQNKLSSSVVEIVNENELPKKDSPFQ